MNLPASGELDTSAKLGTLAVASRVISPATRIAFPDVVVRGGHGAHFWDENGHRFLDLHAMAAIVNIGYGHPRHVDAIVNQARQLVHCNPAYVVHELVVRLAARLVELTPGTFDKRVAFGCTGSDAIDGAIKLARAATGRPNLIAFAGAYHGNTYGALSVSSASTAMRDGFGPVVPGVTTVPFPKTDPADPGATETMTSKALADLEQTVESLNAVGGVAAIVIEPIQGDSGVIVPPLEFVTGMSDIAHRHGVLIIADEVQTAFGRTGRYFASELFGLEPDIVVVGKALGGGMPISAVIARDALMSSWRAPGHVFSTSANPVAAAAALAVLDILEDEHLGSRARSVGRLLRNGLVTIGAGDELVREVRGEGLMIGVQVGDPNCHTSSRTLAAKIVLRCFQRGCFLTFLAGSVLRFVPPLVISESEVEYALDVVEEAFRAAKDGTIPDEAVSHLAGW